MKKDKEAILKEISKKDKQRLNGMIKFVKVFHNIKIGYKDCACSVGPPSNPDFYCCYYTPNLKCKREKIRYCEGNIICAKFTFHRNTH